MLQCIPPWEKIVVVYAYVMRFCTLLGIEISNFLSVSGSGKRIHLSYIGERLFWQLSFITFYRLCTTFQPYQIFFSLQNRKFVAYLFCKKRDCNLIVRGRVINFPRDQELSISCFRDYWGRVLQTLDVSVCNSKRRSWFQPNEIRSKSITLEDEPHRITPTPVFIQISNAVNAIVTQVRFPMTTSEVAKSW